ncbi:hypothetical protein NIES4074_36720 [Cylindrospermum sp. NIES-4074]|nr:hypothetical protein NIES4074_36720 [Cylindrospermum sp. NIES-4074]
MIVVSDTSPLSSLAIVGYLSFLQQIYDQNIELVNAKYRTSLSIRRYEIDKICISAYSKRS